MSGAGGLPTWLQSTFTEKAGDSRLLSPHPVGGAARAQWRESSPGGRGTGKEGTRSRAGGRAQGTQAGSPAAGGLGAQTPEGADGPAAHAGQLHRQDRPPCAPDGRAQPPRARLAPRSHDIQDPRSRSWACGGEASRGARVGKGSAEDCGPGSADRGAGGAAPGAPTPTCRGTAGVGSRRGPAAAR